MRREVGIPIILWICAAAWVHLMMGTGGYGVARLHEDERELLTFAGKVRDRVKASEQQVTVDFEPTDTPMPADPTDPPEPDPKQAQKAVVLAKPTPTTPEPVKPPPPKEEKRVVPLEKVEKKDEPKVQPPPEKLEDKRIAIQQHAKPNQDDNKDAKFIANDANKVEKETVASQTSHDQNDKNPTPAGNHAGPKETVGNGDHKTKIAESEEHKGEKERAPGEKGKEFEPQNNPPSQRPMAEQKVEAKDANKPPASGGDGRTAAAAAKAPEQVVPQKETPASPEVSESRTGGWTFNPLRPGAVSPGTIASSAGKTGDAKKGGETPSPSPMLGLGGKPGPGQVNLNLSHDGVIAAVGVDQLRKERVADGERRLSQHRGSWQSSSFERWRSAIENYVATVQPGNQTALNAARSPFATYLNAMHLRIHPLFADSFLDSLENLPANHPLSDRKMWARLEVVLNKEGRVIKMGVVKPSGVTSFDIAALDSVQRASPFGPAPSAIISNDDRVYLHWDFHRDDSACTTAHARPFLLNVPSRSPSDTPEPPGGPKRPTEEGRPGGNDSKQGAP
jgi:TonB family protein